ncbi:dolichol-phosphate mannosyltransferase subunit 3 [Armillaria borealis]|uniref:Dolichol-phosphate mannosyltransferase subunit 3 n=1 Tax=Armillaria borealis TaxID=47425 RepID=A0AA39IYP0_9AGAR|nr:dolichol-phosphate mannosyltransferase subunit 3 [Armillaria borealis]
MARAHRVAIISLISIALYLSVILQFFSVPFVDDAIVQELIPVVPWWLLVSFGSYSLWSLGWGLWMFRDCPEAYTELMAEISQAKNELRVKGVTVD